MQFSYPFFRFFLKFLGTGRKVGVFVAEQLVGDFSGQKNSAVGMLMDPPAEQIHAHACPDGGDVEGA